MDCSNSLLDQVFESGVIRFDGGVWNFEGLRGGLPIEARLVTVRKKENLSVKLSSMLLNVLHIDLLSFEIDCNFTYDILIPKGSRHPKWHFLFWPHSENYKNE